jgi:nicotinamide riboside kinase
MTETRITRIVVTGSESTGKTTLARELAVHFGAIWVPEQARVYAERVKRPLTAEDVAPIASEQIAAEDAAQAEAVRRKVHWMFLDTDLLSTVVYARHYYQTCPAWIEAEAKARLGELYLVADVDVPWASDSVRDQPQSRDALHLGFQTVLSEFNARKCLVRGLGEGRLAAAVRCISRLET